MKTFKQYTTLSILKFLGILLVTIFITSCGKDGEIGPKGDNGIQGAAGAQGIPGKEGSVILSGSGTPATATGNIGDMYLDKSSSTLYGPKTGAGWGTPLNLKGENGAVGAIGSTILSGTTLPTTIGINGDYYLNKTNADLYGPKTAAGWGAPINLKGSANVVASTWMNLKPWTNNGINYYKDVFYDVPNPILNAVGTTSLNNMLNSGGILLVYFTYKDWSFQIPATITVVFPTLTFNWQVFNSYPNGFLLSVYGANNTAIPADLLNTPGNNDYKIRYVLIPAGIQLTTTANLKNMSYEQVKDLLNLKD